MSQENEWISKKELLELTGLSYGVLYRWKRMQLLPDSWFVRRSTYTGTETFFPRERILRRVEEIQSLKEEMSLEEIAARLAPADVAQVQLMPAEIAERGIADPIAIDQYLALSGAAVPLDQGALLELYLFSRLLKGGTVSRQEAYELASYAAADSSAIAEPLACGLRKYGVLFCITCDEMSRPVFDPGALPVASIPLRAAKAELNTLLG